MSIINKKMKPTFSVILISIILTGCHFSKSVKKDLLSGLTTTGDVLTCNDVYLTVNDEKITRNSFIYGETFYIHYNDIQGFAKENGKVFPAMELSVVDKTGDTLLYSDDLYKGDKEGLSYSPLELSAHLTVATPMRSKDEYMLYVNIKDKKGPGTYSSKLKFSVKPDELIVTEPSGGITYDEIYLFSQENDKAITDGIIAFNDNVYFMIEGLKGFNVDNGFVFPGLSILVTDSNKNEIINSADLFSDYTENGVATSDFVSRVSAHIKITGEKCNNPLHCELNLWDKKGDGKIRVTTNLTVK